MWILSKSHVAIIYQNAVVEIKQLGCLWAHAVFLSQQLTTWWLERKRKERKLFWLDLLIAFMKREIEEPPIEYAGYQYLGHCSVVWACSQDLEKWEIVEWRSWRSSWAFRCFMTLLFLRSIWLSWKNIKY